VDLSQVEHWLPLTAGVVVTLAILLLGYRLVRQRKALVPPETPGVVPLTAGRPADKRGTLRRRGHAVPVLISDTDGSAKPVTGQVLDRSAAGLRLVVEQGMEAGTILGVRPAEFTTLVPWIAVEVTNCRQVDNGWEMGCKFTQPQPLSVLLLFG
jgi:hypothetical protein